MTTVQEQWEIFRAHELKICQQTDPGHLIVRLSAELRAEWINITNKAEYIQALQELQNSLKDVERLCRQVRVRQREIEGLQARSSTWIASSAALKPHQDWKRELQLYLDGLRRLVENIQNFQHEQDSLNAIGSPCGNRRSREYTANLLKTTRSNVSDTQTELDGCKRWLKERDVSQSGDSHGAEPAVEDEDGGERGDRQREPARDSADVREDGVAEGSEGVEGAAPGGGTGAGEDPPGAGDHRGGSGSRGPASQPDIGEPDHEVDEDGEDEEIDDDDDEDEIDEPRDDDYIPFDDENLAPNGHQNDARTFDDDPLRQPEDDLNEDFQEQPEPSGRSDHPSLPDYEDTVVHEQPAPRSQQTSQQPGADREYSSGQISQAQRRSGPGYQPQSPTLATAGALDNPDGGSSDDSSNDRGPPKDPPKRKNKRRDSDKDGPGDGDDEDPGRKRQRKDGSHKSISDTVRELQAIIASLSEPAQEYYRRATSPECTVNLDEWRIAKFVVWLNDLLEDYEWNPVRPVSETDGQKGNSNHVVAAWSFTLTEATFCSMYTFCDPFAKPLAHCF
jgi:hypothetical protein